jgi:ADP-ribose pyrophosphatase YjhB (NUDIX family)
MTSRAVLRARGIGYGLFYRLPSRWRRRLVRLGTAKFVVGAVVLVRTVDGDGPDRLALLRQPPGRAWSLPAGLLRRGERAEAGAARELYEETGLRVRADELAVLQPSAIVHTHGRWIDVVFEARVPADTTFAVDGAEVFEAAWYPLDDLPPLTPPTAHLLGRYGIGPQNSP